MRTPASGSIKRPVDSYQGEQRWQGHPVGSREESCFRRLFYTPYWITFELPTIDMKAAAAGILNQIVAAFR